MKRKFGYYYKEGMGRTLKTIVGFKNMYKLFILSLMNLLLSVLPFGLPYALYSQVDISKQIIETKKINIFSSYTKCDSFQKYGKVFLSSLLVLVLIPAFLALMAGIGFIITILGQVLLATPLAMQLLWLPLIIISAVVILIIGLNIVPIAYVSYSLDDVTSGAEVLDKCFKTVDHKTRWRYILVNLINGLILGAYIAIIVVLLYLSNGHVLKPKYEFIPFIFMLVFITFGALYVLPFIMHGTMTVCYLIFDDLFKEKGEDHIIGFTTDEINFLEEFSNIKPKNRDEDETDSLFTASTDNNTIRDYREVVEALNEDPNANDRDIYYGKKEEEELELTPRPEPVEETITEEPQIEEPVVEETITEEPKVEEPVVEETITEEPKVEEPVVEETVTEEPKVEEPVSEETITEEPKVEESVVEETITEEPKVEESVVEETITEEPTVLEQVVEETITEESKVEEPVSEETKPEESESDEPSLHDLINEALKAQGEKVVEKPKRGRKPKAAGETKTRKTTTKKTEGDEQ